ncbi:AMMECR1 superfamily [Methylophaga thiooxydans DMS010]|uniref:AMMECR1 superfamily n=2 Tax=Methylophaga thiooxydans TaxID=392484 RepID=C0N1S4_9GAMM|nr:AMMECR1 superfamily [Methylophaga thiooxydans DMS010]
MVPICFNKMLPDSDRFLLKKIARDAIHYGLANDTPMPLDTGCLPTSVLEKQASFVTLFIAGALRGCIGSLTAVYPLAEDVAKNAYAAAFRDHRFETIAEPSVADLEIHISVLSEPQIIPCNSEYSLLEQLHPGRDGLIIEDGQYRATFLPAVWDAIPSPERFVHELKRKAGLDKDYWSATLLCYRYHTETF